MSQPNNVFDENHMLNVGRENPDCERNRAIRQEGKRKRSTGADDMESQLGDSQNLGEQPDKTKHKRRHTIDQIQEMEKFFLICPIPNEKERRELGQQLSLEPRQIKFWFQNKRSQMKSQHKSTENIQLRTENDKLRVENSWYEEAFRYAACPNCDGPAAMYEMSFNREQLLRHENALLLEEINRINASNEYHLGNTMHLPSGSGSAPHNLDQGIGTSFAPSTSLPSERYHFGR